MAFLQIFGLNLVVCRLLSAVELSTIGLFEDRYHSGDVVDFAAVGKSIFVEEWLAKGTWVQIFSFKRVS